MERVVKILSKEELDKRYSKLADSNMAKLTKEAIERGYSIAYVKAEGLWQSQFLLSIVQTILDDYLPKTSDAQIWCFTDLSELPKNNIVYCAFKEVPSVYYRVIASSGT